MSNSTRHNVHTIGFLANMLDLFAQGAYNQNRDHKNPVEKVHERIMKLSCKQPVQQNSFYYWFSPPA